MKAKLLVFIFLSPLLLFGQENSAEDTAQTNPEEMHYKFLKEEIQTYRQFIQEERKQHQQFLGWTVGIVGSLGLLLLGYFGLKNREDIQKTREVLLSNAQRELELEVKEARLEFEKEVQSTFESNPYLKDAQQKYEKLTEMVSQQLAVEAGKFLLIANKEKAKDMKRAELPTFEKAINALTLSPDLDQVQLDDFDVVLYRSGVDQEGEDAFLKNQLLPQLEQFKAQGVFIPLVIYCKGRSEFLRANTEKAVNEYGLATIANYTTTLIDNTASAFRVAKLMGRGE